MKIEIATTVPVNQQFDLQIPTPNVLYLQSRKSGNLNFHIGVSRILDMTLRRTKAATLFTSTGCYAKVVQKPSNEIKL